MGIEFEVAIELVERGKNDVGAAQEVGAGKGEEKHERGERRRPEIVSCPAYTWDEEDGELQEDEALGGGMAGEVFSTAHVESAPWAGDNADDVKPKSVLWTMGNDKTDIVMGGRNMATGRGGRDENYAGARRELLEGDLGGGRAKFRAEIGADYRGGEESRFEFLHDMQGDGDDLTSSAEGRMHRSAGSHAIAKRRDGAGTVSIKGNSRVQHSWAGRQMGEALVGGSQKHTVSSKSANGALQMLDDGGESSMYGGVNGLTLLRKTFQSLPSKVCCACAHLMSCSARLVIAEANVCLCLCLCL